ncbi:hypothetical protein [Nocardia brasiliensis]|uniref:hypothetical protein n=1 Tax=Nocardia brasiliensis TaxID=37326 RepID=UPI00366B9590
MSVPAVVERGTTRGYASTPARYGLTSQYRVDQTDLARTLDLPERRPRAMVGLGIALLILAGLVHYAFFQSQTSADTSPTTLVTAVAVPLIITWLPWGLGFLAWRAGRRAQARYDQAQAWWAALYYCARDHVVYFPGEPEVYNPTQAAAVAKARMPSQSP